METLLAYLNALTQPERKAFCKRCGTSEGYLRKAVSAGQRLGESICINIERESGRKVTVETLRPDVDWAYLRESRAA